MKYILDLEFMHSSKNVRLLDHILVSVRFRAWLGSNRIRSFTVVKHGNDFVNFVMLNYNAFYIG